MRATKAELLLFDPGKLLAAGLEYLRPNDTESEEINRIIMDEDACA